MKLRTIRTEVKERGEWADRLALCHPKMLLIILLITTIGHLLAPGKPTWGVYLFGILGMTFLALGSYRLNEIHDRTTAPSLNTNDHIISAIYFFGFALACASYLAYVQGWWIWIMVIVGGGLTALYNLDVHPLIHNRPVYGMIWGGMPLIFSAMTQAGSPIPTPATLVLGAWASVVAVYSLWLWGPTTCGRMAICTRANGEPSDRLCHSPVLKCMDRLVMPGEVHNHMKVLIDLNLWSVILLTIGLTFIEFGGGL
ncbi:hypothetical protein LCGC14_0999140 [marine sediment metagenome]|uniref:Prenyltransferase n=1 Tax=marine sediment metagenome TaxID=412755 RepID=A0A0F9QM04_9ZZZZ